MRLGDEIMRLRFEIEKEPTDTWAVFDTLEDVPAEMECKTLIGLSHDEASLALFRLNIERLRSWRRRS